MKAKLTMMFMMAVLFGSSGCRTIRGIEQWKCDNWGLCHFGIKPSKNKSSVSHQHSPSDTEDCGCNPPQATAPPTDIPAPSTWR